VSLMETQQGSIVGGWRRTTPSLPAITVAVQPAIDDPPSIGIAQFDVIVSVPDEVQVREFQKSAWFKDVVGTLPGILGLQRGWNGHGAGPIQLGAISAGLSHLWSILEPSSRAPKTFPRADGGVNFEWTTADFALSLSADRWGQVELSYEDNETDWGGRPEEMPGSVRNALRRLAATEHP
jgi:hypothetical protein